MLLSGMLSSVSERFALFDFRFLIFFPQFGVDIVLKGEMIGFYKWSGRTKFFPSIIHGWKLGSIFMHVQNMRMLVFG